MEPRKCSLCGNDIEETETRVVGRTIYKIYKCYACNRCVVKEDE